MEDNALQQLCDTDRVLFRVNTSTHPQLLGIKNQWVIVEYNGEYHVLLETQKINKTSRAHAGAFDTQSKAIEFAIKLKEIFTAKSQLHSS